MQVQEANQDYNEEIVAEREAILQRKKDKILQRQYDDVKKLREEQEARGCSFHQMIENFKNTLKHEDYTLTGLDYCFVVFLREHLRTFYYRLKTSSEHLLQTYEVYE